MKGCNIPFVDIFYPSSPDWFSRGPKSFGEAHRYLINSFLFPTDPLIDKMLEFLRAQRRIGQYDILKRNLTSEERALTGGHLQFDLPSHTQNNRLDQRKAKPTPDEKRATEEPPCAKGENMIRCRSRIIPIPVAETANAKASLGGQLTVTLIAPLLVNFRAFERNPFRTTQQLGSAIKQD
jgi:hypothetical protein